MYIRSYLDSISRSLDIHVNKYENMILLGHFNANIDDFSLKRPWQNYDLRSLIKEAACSKNPDNSSGIDLILTNKLQSFI